MIHGKIDFFFFFPLYLAPSREEHTAVPDFSSYKRPNSGVPEGDYSRRVFTYALTAAGAVVGAHAAKNVVQDFLATMSASVRNGLFMSFLLIFFSLRKHYRSNNLHQLPIPRPLRPSG